jgi:PAS domain S-box-containing protein
VIESSIAFAVFTLVVVFGLALALGVAAGSLVRARRLDADRRRELSEKQHTEAALRRSLKDLEDLTYALDQSAIVATTDVRGTITSVNETFCLISRYSRDELIGQNHRLLNSGLHPAEFFREMYATIGNGRVWRGELRNRAKDGTLYWVDTTIVPFLDDRQHPYQYIAIRYDITERKRSEAALRDQNALAQLGKMAAVVAHEVRNPLAGIRGALQVIGSRMPAGSGERAILEEVVARVDTLSEIVQDLLLFARPTRPVLAPVPVAAIVHDTVGLFREDPSVAEVVVEVEPTDAVVMADGQQIKLVLLNLLMNGAQAMQGQGDITISTHVEGTFRDIRIADHGPGISPDVREHLFEPFFTTRHRGTGLGLVTARRLMEAHGGTVLLECPPTGGTVATVRVPAG